MRIALQKLKAIWTQNRILILITILFTLAFTAIIWLSTTNRKAIQRAKIAENNIAVLQDSVRVTYNKWQEAEYAKKTFVVQEPQDLEALSKDIYEELQKIKGEIKSIQKTNVVVKPPDVTIPITPQEPGKYNFSFNKTYSPGNFEGFDGTFNTESLTMEQKNRQIGIALTLALRKNKDGSFENIVKSDFPGLVITKIEGAQIDKNVFKSPLAKQPLIKAFTFNVGQEVFSYNYNKKELKLFQPEITGNVGISVDLKKLLKKK